MIRVLIADDHALVRAGIRALLAALPDIYVVGEAADGREALRLIEEFSPAVALMDVSLPGLDGLEALAGVTARFPATRVLVLSMHVDEAQVREALAYGAAGYFLKGANLTELHEALRAIAAGETYVSPSLSGALFPLPELSADREAPGAELAALTPRQQEVLQLTVEGLTMKEIASQLGVSVKTVEAHRHQIARRLRIRDVPGLVRFAIRSGLTTSDR